MKALENAMATSNSCSLLNNEKQLRNAIATSNPCSLLILKALRNAIIMTNLDSLFHISFLYEPAGRFGGDKEEEKEDGQAERGQHVQAHPPVDIGSWGEVGA